MERINKLERNLEVMTGAHSMRKLIARLSVAALLIGSALQAPGCAEPGGDIDRTQTNLVDKSVFEGEWWYMRTVNDIDDDAAFAISQAGAGAPWPGAMANYDIASRSGVSGRIRWVIDENFLFAYRSHEVVFGAAEEADEDGYLGQPLAAFRIEGHVDVRREYNPVTGEPQNVISEGMDRRWYDRQYVRVDWSVNLVTWGLFGAGLDIDGLFGGFRREAVGNFVQEGGDARTPDSWRPQFVRIGDDPTYRLAAEWPTEMADTVHYMSFVTNEVWTPLFCGGATCNTSVQLGIRHAFLRIPPNHEYAAETLPNSEYDRFGIIRTESRTYTRGGEDRSVNGTYCDARCTAACDVPTCDQDSDCGDDGTGSCVSRRCVAGTYSNPDQCGDGGRCRIAVDGGWQEAFGTCEGGIAEDADDCGVGTVCDYATHQCSQALDADCGPGLCDLATNLCQGGLTPDYGETDFLTFYRLRHNFYSDSLTDQTCVADWQCDGRYGGAPSNGSRCDVAANRCTIPLRDRPVRPVGYYLNAGFPRHLVREAFEVTSQWNESFMRGNRELHNRPLPTGPRVAAQDINPMDYCFSDGTTVAAEVAADGTCAARTNFFIQPEARGQTEPYDCWIGLRNADGTGSLETAAVNPASPTSFSDYPAEVYNYAFFGTECMLLLNTNSCDRPVAEGEEPAACEELGDIRYQFFNYASGAGAGWCGVMQQVQDPLTGEAISIPINMGGLCLENIGRAPLELWRVLRGEIGEDTLFTGENVRGYFERLGNVHSPVGLAPAIDGSRYQPEDGSRPEIPAASIDLNRAIQERFAQVAPRIQNLRSGNEGRAAILSDRMRLLQGTDIERRLVDAIAMEGPNAIEGMDVQQALDSYGYGSPEPTSQQLMEQLSPFRDGFRNLMLEDRRREMILAENHVCYTREALFTSRYNQYWAEAFRDRAVEEAQIRWMQGNFRSVMLHEMGHGLGLEHNFAGSYDRDHYSDGYFSLVTETDASGDHVNALPVMDDFDCGRDGLCPGDTGYTAADETEGDTLITGVEQTRWIAAVRDVRTRRANRGIGNYMTSSLMDYNGDFSDLAGLGYYDRAAVYFNYFDLVEAYEGNPEYAAGASTSLDGLLRSDITPRTLWTWYRGGESCQTDAQCPHAAGSTSLVQGQPIYQRCIRNTRYSDLPVPCNGDRNCMCSNFDEDFVDLAQGAYAGYPTDAFGSCSDGTRCLDGTTCGDGATCFSDGAPDFERVEYMFCSNPRLGDISWCNTFDAGESFQETIDHYRQLWQEGYPRSYYRNYRRGFASGSRATRYIIDAAKMYQHLFFRYYYEPEFRQETGPLGFNDQYFASIDAMNWLAELAQLPDVGSYRMRLIDGPTTCDLHDPTNPANPVDQCHYGYEQISGDIGAPGADFSLEPGVGYNHWSRYQDGLYGFFRMERAGVFWDKYIALLALTIRDWGLSFTIDERYFINFYDLFPLEMTEIFGGHVIDDPRWMAPRARVEGGEPQVQYLNYLLGLGYCRNPTTGEFITCDTPATERFTDPPILGTSNEILRLYASIFALSEFPVFYDPSFESRLAVFKLDNADGFTIPDVQVDGLPTQAFGQAIPGSGHNVTADPTDADYIMYVSERLHTPYVAVKVRERLDTVNLEEEQLGFQLLQRLMELQDLQNQLEAETPTPENLERLQITRTELQRGESFLEALIEVQRIFGITSWL
jgi:hypothetical protein